MRTYTYRPEISDCDEIEMNRRLSLDGRFHNVRIVDDEHTEGWTCGRFEMSEEIELSELKEIMFELDAKYGRADLHRCAQTVALGLTPNFEWYLD